MNQQNPQDTATRNTDTSTRPRPPLIPAETILKALKALETVLLLAVTLLLGAILALIAMALAIRAGEDRGLDDGIADALIAGVTDVLWALTHPALFLTVMLVLVIMTRWVAPSLPLTVAARAAKGSTTP